VDMFSFSGRPCFFSDRDFGLALRHNPVFGPVVVHLQAEALSGFHMENL
jgi:hypothetical protein